MHIHHHPQRNLLSVLANNILNKEYISNGYFYTYDDNNGLYYVGTINSSRVFYESYEGSLKTFWAKQGSYCFAEVELNNGRINENIIIKNNIK